MRWCVRVEEGEEAIGWDEVNGEEIGRGLESTTAEKEMAEEGDIERRSSPEPVARESRSHGHGNGREERGPCGGVEEIPSEVEGWRRGSGKITRVMTADGGSDQGYNSAKEEPERLHAVVSLASG